MMIEARALLLLLITVVVVGGSPDSHMWPWQQHNLNQVYYDQDTTTNSTALMSRRFSRALVFPSGSLARFDIGLFIPTYSYGDFSGSFSSTLTFKMLLPTETSTSFVFGKRLDNQREIVYSAIEKTVSRFGVDGHMCLLRTICEVGEQPYQDNGAMGEIMNALMSASYQWQDEAMYEYVEAEYYGRYYGNCHEAYPCQYSASQLLDALSHVL